MDATPSVGRLRWRCRRGMRELDILLSGFLEREYPKLAPEQQQAFASLIECQDPDILDWLMDRRNDYPIGCGDLIQRLASRARQEPVRE